MILRRILAKILQAGQRALAQLHLVQHNQCSFAHNRLPGNMRKHGNQIIRADILGKRLRQPGRGFKVEIRNVIVMRAAKFQHGIGFAHLARTLQNQRLAMRAVFPRFQITHDFTIQKNPLPSDGSGIVYQ